MVEQTVPPFIWFSPTRVLFGAGEISKLGSSVDEVAGSRARVFLVTGRQSLRARGLLDGIVNSIGADRVTLFDQVTPYPAPEMVDRAAEACRQAAADVVVAVGGGSPIDLGKAVAMLAIHDGKAEEFALGDKAFDRAGLPFVAAPTTSGSSSEVTRFTALWDMEAKRSLHLGSPDMFPDVAIVDPELTMSMSKTLAAATGMDAFTSAFESYWSPKAQPTSDALNLGVIRLFAENLERSCIQGDLESRASCALAATMSGMAYSNSLPNVCHGIGTPLTIYWGVSHGQAVGITLPSFLRWVAPAIRHKLPTLLDALGAADVEGGAERITRMMERCGLETRLGGLGLSQADMGTLLENIRWDRVAELSRSIDREGVGELLRDLL